MTKKISMKAKPRAAAADEWVKTRQTNGEPPQKIEATAPVMDDEEMKRFTIDVPVSLHKRIKTQCAARGVTMADELRTLLERHFPGA